MNTIKNVLHEEGLRYTHQRKEIWKELLSSSAHRDAEEIYFSLVKKGIRVSRATVYRTIDVLVKNNVIDKLEIGDGKARYEYNNKFDHHDHLICTTCGKIIEFQDNDIEKIQRKIAEEHGFQLVEHNHQLFGICGDCQ